jgi:hypothetical protein
VDAGHYRGTGIAPAENHVLLLEDESSHCQREGLVWKLKEVDLKNNEGMIVASREAKAGGDGKASEEKLTFDAATRVWRGREATILTSRLDYSVSPRLSFFNLVQYDNRSRNLGWQSRARWSPQPGNDVFLVFQQGWVHEPGDLRFQAADRKASAKVQYSIRF